MSTYADPGARHGMEVRLLGPFSVTVSGERVQPHAWRLAKAQRIVKLLSLDSRHRLHRDVLLEQLWPDRDPRSAANNLYQALSAARSAIASVGGDGHESLRLEQEWVRLEPVDGLWVDVEAFETLSRSEDERDLREALSLYRGELLADDRYAEWATVRRAALGRLHNDLLQRLAEHCLDAGDLGEAQRLLERLLDDDPADERAHQTLMRVHAQSGNRAAAQQQYIALEDALREHLDLVPGPESRHLLELIRTGTLETGASRVALPAPGSTPTPNNLPTALSSFVGHQRELAELPRAIGRHRLVTLTGPGGCGKTRLAAEVAARCLGAFEDGVFLVELGPLTSRSQVVQEIARTLGVRATPPRRLLDTIADRVGAGRLLLLLDNCEHLVDAAAEVAETLLSACSRLAVMATSREPLRLPGEWVHRVPSLRLPDLDDLPPPEALTQYEAVRLLVDRVAARDPDFAIDAGNAVAAVQICVRLDGLPLAIELAAALVPALTLAAVAEGLDDRFRLLVVGRRTGLTRHQTLEAAIAWSFELLPEEQRDLLCRLATLRDSFDVTAAAAVAGGGTTDDHPAAMAARLADLAHRSMVVGEPVSNQPRFRLLETIREYAVSLLHEQGRLDEALDAHARWCAAFVNEAARELAGPEHHRWLARLELSRSDLRAALARLRDIDPAESVRLTAALWTYWLWFGYLDDGMQELEAALAVGDAPSEARSACWLSLFALRTRRTGLRSPEVRRLVANAVAEGRAARSPKAEARALVYDGIHRMFIEPDPYDSVSRRLRRAEEIASSVGLVAERGAAVHARAVLAAHYSRHEASRQDLLATRRLLDSPLSGCGPVLLLPVCPVVESRRLGVPWLVWEETLMPRRATAGGSALAYVEANLGSLARAMGRPGEARRHLETSLATYRAAGDAPGEALSRTRLGWQALDEGALERARRLLEQAEASYSRVGDVRGRHMVLLGLSRVAIERGDLAAARSLLEAVLRAARQQGDRPVVAAALTVRGTLEVAEGELDAAIGALREAHEHNTVLGHRLSLAVAGLDLADALRRGGRPAEAVGPARAAGTVFRHLGYQPAADRCRRIVDEAGL